FRTMRLQELDRADGEQRAEGKAHAGGIPHLRHRYGESERQALTAIFGVEGEPIPAALDISGIGVAKPRRGANDTVLENTAGAIGRLVERRQLVAGELCRFA